MHRGVGGEVWQSIVEWSRVKGGAGRVDWCWGMVWYGKWEDRGGENIVEWSRAGYGTVNGRTGEREGRGVEWS